MAYDLPTTGFIDAFNRAAAAAYAIAFDHGFWDGPENNHLVTKLALIHSEATEALEAIRDKSGRGGYQPSTHIPEFNALEEELADIVIRVMDWSAGAGLRVGAAIMAKMAFNADRSHRHGGKAF
jgi:NTP pyrophosphatase (non-canonical NTP hydrolase)